MEPEKIKTSIKVDIIRPTPKIISVVIPVFNEEKNILVLYASLTDVLHPLQSLYDYELIFINDGSEDNSWLCLTELAVKDKRVKALNFSRNFGHQIALRAGYDRACGDAVISMDADMQHPPEMIPNMIGRWKKGAEIVCAQRSNRNDGFLKKITANVFYKLLDTVSEIKIPQHVADFRLLDKKVVSIITSNKEKNLYLRGMVAWTGFKQDIVSCDYLDRHAGKTGYSWKKMWKLAFDGLTGFSMMPLKTAAYAGVLVIASGLAMFAFITAEALIFKAHYPLFKWLVTIIYIFMGVQFLLLWLLGEYIGRMYDQQRDRPLYIVTEKINFNEKDLRNEY